jgi:hypothetical protein
MTVFTIRRWLRFQMGLVSIDETAFEIRSLCLLRYGYGALDGFSQWRAWRGLRFMLLLTRFKQARASIGGGCREASNHGGGHRWVLTRGLHR